MLFHDDKRFVELMIDNILRGNITIDWENVSDEEDPPLHILIRDYMECKRKKCTPKADLIFCLSFNFESERLFGNIKGLLRDTKQENKIRELTKDNRKLSEQLDSAYIPSRDSKVGTT